MWKDDHLAFAVVLGGWYLGGRKHVCDGLSDNDS